MYVIYKSELYSFEIFINKLFHVVVNVLYLTVLNLIFSEIGSTKNRLSKFYLLSSCKLRFINYIYKLSLYNIECSQDTKF